MQLSTLNRVIALFLIGGLVVAITAMAYESWFQTHLQKYSALPFGPAAGVVAAVVLLSVTALAGTIVDAIGNVTIRRFVRMMAKTRWRAFFFFCGEEFDEQDRWLTKFTAVVKSDARYSVLVSNDETMMKPLSAGLFFRTAQKEHAEWLVQHHSMYNLCANFVVVIAGCVVWAWVAHEAKVVFGGIAASYLLITFALDNYLYTYQLSFRNAFLAVVEPRESNLGAKSSPLSSVPNEHERPAEVYEPALGS